MTHSKPNPLVRFLPSFTDVAFLMPVVFLFTIMRGIPALLGDGDTGWHIRTGDWIRAQGQVPHQDIFSYTMPDAPWYAWEWLWDVAASWAHQHWGLAGVAIPSLFLICLTFGLLYKLVLRQCANPLLAIGLTVLATSGSTIHWLARPHLVTFVLTVVFAGILIRAGEGQKRLLWWLPILTILWTNLHGGFIVGLIMIGAWGAGELLRAVLTADSSVRRTSLQSFGRYLATGLGCLAASLVNPYTYQLHVHVWEYLGDPYTRNNIIEFQSTSFHWVQGFCLEIMLVLAVGAVVWYARRGRYSEVILLLGWGHLSLIAVRNLPLFMILAAPLVALPLAEAIREFSAAPVAGWLRTAANEFQEIAAEMASIERFPRLYPLSIGVLAIVALLANAPGGGEKLQGRYDPETYPEAALSMLDSSQRIFTNDEWGDYLIYQLYPHGTPVFVDGRSDFYGPDFGEAYLDLMRVKYDWQEKLDKYGVDTVVLPPSAALASTLKESRRWKVVYDDGIAIVFRTVSALSGEQDPGRFRASGEWRDQAVPQSGDALPASRQW